VEEGSEFDSFAFKIMVARFSENIIRIKRHKKLSSTEKKIRLRNSHMQGLCWRFEKISLLASSATSPQCYCHR
jgi:hypothetical protein